VDKLLAMLGGKVKLALIQMLVGADKAKNVHQAVTFIAKAAAAGAQLAILPECFNCPYGTQYFSNYAEAVPGPTMNSIAAAARENKIHVVAGSVPERTPDDRLLNTSVVFNTAGELIARHSKVHLFDIDVPGGITFRESDALTAGSNLDQSTFDLGEAKVGLAICYDLRFPELAHYYMAKGCTILIYPGAFNMTTGPVHWQLLARARAVDNQCFVALCSPARDTNASYVAYGHSLVVDPWGIVLDEADENEQILYADIELNRVAEVRRNIPIRQQKRADLYNVQK